jgi:hypothetical protein
MSMTDRAVKSPLETIYPLDSKKETMDGFAFMEKRDQEVARGGIEIDEAAVRRDLLAEYAAAHPGKTLSGVELREAINDRLNKIDVLLLNLFGCQVDDPGNFEQEFAVARIVGAMNDSLITPTCERVDNPINDRGIRGLIALDRARKYFRDQVDFAMSFMDRASRSTDPLTNYVKFVHAPPKMIRHRLSLLEDEYKRLLDYVNFTGLIKRWEGGLAMGPVPQGAPSLNNGVGGALEAVRAMGAGVMATLPEGAKDLNTPFNQKQGGYWAAEYKLYEGFVKGHPVSLQVLDDEAQRKAGLKIGTANEIQEQAYEIFKEGYWAMRGVNSSEEIRGGALKEYVAWVIEMSPNLTFIGGKAPVVTYYHIAAGVAASMVGMEFVPPYLDKNLLCYVTLENGERKYLPVGVNDGVAEYGDFYPNLPEAILALVGVEKDNSGKALISPGRISPLPVIGMQLGTYTTGGVRRSVYRESDYLHNPGAYAGSKKLFPTNKSQAYALMLQGTFNHLCDLGLLDKGEKKALIKGLHILPESEHFELE